VTSTVNRKVGVIGTQGTIDSGAYSDAVRALDAGATVFSVATPKFVDAVESGLRMGPGSLEDWLAQTADVYVRPAFHEIARDYLDPLKRAGVDTLVLGCTHFPLLSTAIQRVMGSQVRLISSAEETAREVAEILAARGQSRVSEEPPAHRFTTSGDPDEFRRLGSRVLRRRIDHVDGLDVAELTALSVEPTTGE
jgi:glutamate racemase